MTVIETSGCLQDAVLWPFLKHDSNGEPVVSDPVEILVRWEHTVMQALNNESGSIVVTAAVMVDLAIAPGSIMRLGTLDSVPDPPNKLVEVVDFVETPDVKARNFQRSVIVRRWERGLPLAS